MGFIGPAVSQLIGFQVFKSRCFGEYQAVMAYQASLAILAQNIRWTASASRVRIARGITVGQADQTPALRLYERLCFGLGIEDGEPIGFNLCLQFDGRRGLDAGSAFSDVDRLCNLLVLFANAPILTARKIVADPSFRRHHSIEFLYSAYDSSPIESSGSGSDYPFLDDDRMLNVKRAWSATRDVKSRMFNALMFYYHAWRSLTAEPICLNLAIVLETLFAPHDQGETTHQLAFNTAHFLGGNPSVMRTTYKTVREFYRVRSAVVHGGRCDPHSLFEMSQSGFLLVPRVLQKALTGRSLVRRFNDEKARKKMLAEFMFGREGASKPKRTLAWRLHS
jgi:hypothetical protein